MKTCIVILSILVSFLYLKWIVIFIVLPFQSIYVYLRKKWYHQKMPFTSKLLAAPYYFWEMLFRGGWAKYMSIQVGYLPSFHLRKFVYKCIGAEIDKKVIIHYGTEVLGAQYLKIGEGTIIGDKAVLDARKGIIFGRNVNLSSNVTLHSDQHDHRDPYFGCNQKGKKIITICDRVWLGCNVIVLPGVTIGEGAVCCAGCVVTKDVEPFTVVAGIPAQKVNERPRDLRYEFDGRPNRLY